MGNATAPAPGSASAPTLPPHGPSSTAARPSCPVHNSTSDVQNSASIPSNTAPTSANSSSCPVKGKYKNPTVYNVYGQPIDTRNNMPANPNNQPVEGQTKPLSTERVQSTIPRGGTNDTWMYPSPQMFWNALVRKEKVGGAHEDDMDTVVAIHNNMNETTWRQVLAWEALHPTLEEDKQPRLLKFQGRPTDTSPKAFLKSWFGHPLPFDRHDWIVDRGGKSVRYIIDYYHDEAVADKDSKPSLTDAHSIKSIKVDVRPALDSPEAFLDRLLRMPLAELAGKTAYAPPPFFASPETRRAETRLREENEQIRRQWANIKLSCEPHNKKLEQCQGEEDCGRAAMLMTYCMAGYVCPDKRRKFTDCKLDDFESSYEEMDKEVKAFLNKVRDRSIGK